jgi:hypothetical protein
MPILTKSERSDITNEYYGGDVEVCIPEGFNLHYYDVNSLYPFSMLNDMPVGEPVYTTDPDLNNIFGFVEVEVTAPTNLKYPVLPYRTKEGLIIKPVGNWTGWYFTEEIKMAVNEYGYTAKVLQGYRFERSNKVFKDYINHFYSIKNSSTGIERQIAKLFLNSLYGRLGMHSIHSRSEIVLKSMSDAILIRHKARAPVNLSDLYELITYEILPDPELYAEFDLDYTEELLSFDQSIFSLNASVGIASAITAYSRMYINLFKQIPDNTCFYTDTDSVVLKNELPQTYTGKDIGKFKLEYNVIHGEFAAPKPAAWNSLHPQELITLLRLNLQEVLLLRLYYFAEESNTSENDKAITKEFVRQTTK